MLAISTGEEKTEFEVCKIGKENSRYIPFAALTFFHNCLLDVDEVTPLWAPSASTSTEKIDSDQCRTSKIITVAMSSTNNVTAENKPHHETGFMDDGEGKKRDSLDQ
ncbi:hypothetical protein TNCV_3443281 [Trichonephila clavipes]|nr:hypothetical protein TNCV_3443281 [Trichonephila clavipes]